MTEYGASDDALAACVGKRILKIGWARKGGIGDWEPFQIFLEGGQVLTMSTAFKAETGGVVGGLVVEIAEREEIAP